MAREDRRVARIVFRKQMDPESQAWRGRHNVSLNIDLTNFRHRNKLRYFGLDPNDPQ